MPDGELEALRAERALLRTVVDRVSAMLAYWDSTLRCRFANRAYERWFGVSPEVLIGKHISELLGPLYELNLPHIEAALAGQAQEFEREIPDPAGGPARHSLANYIPDVADGVVRGFVVLVTDISKRKRFELALQESEAKFAGIVSIAADAIISIDEDQRVTIFNDGAERIFGYPRSEVLGHPLDLLLPARLRAQHRRDVEGFGAGHTTARQMGERNAEIVGLRKSGEEFPAEAAISKLDSGGKTLLTVALRDITERRRTELEQEVIAEAGTVLASSLNYEQTLAAIARLIVPRVTDLCAVDIVEDPDLVRLTWTPADPAKESVCARLSALPLLRRHLLSWSAYETKQTVLLPELGPDQWEQTAQNPEHLQLLREIAPRSAVFAPMSSIRGVFGALVLASSKPGRFQARDVGFANELARRAALAIENARLYESAQRATRARDEVLGVVAHDVRNPLSSIRLAANVLGHQLRASGSDKGAAKSVEVIVRSVERADRLIQDLLDTTRLEAGALSVAPEAMSAAQIVKDVVEAQRPLASSASLELRLRVDGTLPQIWADRDRVLQVLENLVGNAIKFTAAGGCIIVGAAPGVEEVLFSVADSGAGISAENLPRLFDRFWQAKRADRQGAGLGLPICKGIVEAHRGRIWVESAPNRGTTVYFTIPAAPSASDRCAPSAPL